METEAKQEVTKLREWVDDLRIPKPVEAPKEPAVHDPKPQGNVLKAPAEISEGARRTQKIIESMDLRRQERARMVAALKSREVEVAREDAAAFKRLDDAVTALNEEHMRRLTTLHADHDGGLDARAADMHARQQQIEKLDASLAQLRKQLDAELGKLDPLHEERKGGA